MAFTEFYVQSTGSNLNAGSTTDDAAAVTVTNASWDVTADTYIGLTGTEFAAVNVGDWASIYLDAATVAVYIAQVTAVGALGVSITLSTTAKYGTKPASGATGRSCKVGGAHASLTPWNSTGLGASTVPASTRVNVKQATYTRTATDTVSMVGITTGPLWFRGYNTTVGDCDADPTLTKPVLSYNATFQLSTSGANQVWSSVSVLGNRTGTVWTGATSTLMVRCRFENTSSAAGAIAASPSGGDLLYCWCKTPTTATTAVNLTNGSVFTGTVFENGRVDCSNDPTTFLQCVSLNSGGVGILSAGVAQVQVYFTTIYNATSHGISWTVAGPGFVYGCAFWDCGGWGISQSSGTDTHLVRRACNSFFSNTSGTETGFGDSPSFFQQTESAQPYTSATDMTPLATALAAEAGFAPGVFENMGFRSYVDIGAVQRKGTRGGVAVLGATFSNPNLLVGYH